MKKRDALCLVLACVAMLISLNIDNHPFSFRKTWYHKYSDYESDSLDEELSEHHLLPQPKIVDLNGDGHLEVLLVTPSYKLQVVSPQRSKRAGEGFLPAKLLTQASLLQRHVGASAERRPVALAAGFIDTPPVELVRAPRKQVTVVVTASQSVICYDHNLKILWEKNLEAIIPAAAAHAHIKEVAVYISPHKVLASDRGMVVIGVSLIRGDLSSGEGLQTVTDGAAGRSQIADADVLDAELLSEKEVAAHSRSARETDEVMDLNEGRGLDTSRHFNYYGVEGGTGEERWHHSSQDFHKDLSDLAKEMRPQNDFRLDAEKLEGRHFGEASCREYRGSVLHVLPHSWSAPVDTELAEAYFVKHKQGVGAHKEGLAKKGHRGGLPPPNAPASRGGGASHEGKGILKTVARMSSQRQARATGSATSTASSTTSGHGQGGKHNHAHHAHHAQSPHQNITANVLVAYLEEGIEVVHLYSGRTVCKLHLAPGELHADVNGDGVLDHVQVFEGVKSAKEASSIGGAHSASSPCTLRVLSGIPPTHRLYEARICLDNFMARMNSISGAGFLEEEEAVSTDDMQVATPIFLPLPKATHGRVNSRSLHGLVVALTSRGEVTALNSRGQVVWQAVHPVAWVPQSAAGRDSEEASAAPPQAHTLLPISLHTHGMPSSVLAAGASSAVILSEHGNVLETVWLPYAPIQPMLAVDFDADRLVDLIAVTPNGIYGWSQEQQLGGTTLPSVMLVMLLGMLLLLWGSKGGSGSINSSGAAGKTARKLRSTDCVD